MIDYIVQLLLELFHNRWYYYILQNKRNNSIADQKFEMTLL
jgi:hypothetical protein